MSSLPSSRRGYSLLELMVILAVAGAVSVVAAPKLAMVILKAKTTQCSTTRIIVERAEERYRADHDGLSSAGVTELKAARYIDRIPWCTSGGYLVWLSTSAPVKMGCSIHEWTVTASTAPAAAPAPLTPLGSTFTEISGGFIQLAMSYKDKTGKWPRSWSPYNFTDLGLTAADFAKSVEHLLYSPVGDRIKIRPESGWNIKITGVKGAAFTLTAASNLDLIYSLQEKAWYYKSIESKYKVDIATMKVVPA